MTETKPAVVGITIADEPAAWTDAGFTVENDCVQVGTISLHVIGRSQGAKGIRSWSWSNLPGDGTLDGLVTVPSTNRGEAGRHANGATTVDHVVVVTPDLTRTIAAFEGRSVPVRRTRDTDQYGRPFRQIFFRAGETIIELIGPIEVAPGDDRPARFYGLAFTVQDLDAGVAMLGAGIGPIKDAVQPGRSIATLRHAQYDISVPIALMSA